MSQPNWTHILLILASYLIALIIESQLESPNDLYKKRTKPLEKGQVNSIDFKWDLSCSMEEKLSFRKVVALLSFEIGFVYFSSI